MIDIFNDSKYKGFYEGEVPRPQPSDFAVNFFNGKVGGIFVDVGASDGITWSNTLPFEINYGWNGLCIEPHPVAFAKLKQNRKNTCLNLAASNTDEEVNFIVVEGYAEMLSGISKFYDPRHKDRLVGEVEKHNDKVYKQKINAKSLQTVFNEYNLKYIDYLSVDTEGSELIIIDGINFDETKINLISLEVNYELTPVNEAMERKGYSFLEKICGDAFYKKKNSG